MINGVKKRKGANVARKFHTYQNKKPQDWGWGLINSRSPKGWGWGFETLRWTTTRIKKPHKIKKRGIFDT